MNCSKLQEYIIETRSIIIYFYYVLLGYNRLQYVTTCFNRLRWVTRSYGWLQQVMIGYNRLQSVTNSNSGLRPEL